MKTQYELDVFDASGPDVWEFCFAVAATPVVAAGLPTTASLPAVAFGVVEMATGAGFAKWFSRDA